MNRLRIFGSSALLVLTACAPVSALLVLSACASTASGTVQEIDQRIDSVLDVEFSWAPLGIPAVDGPIAGFVAYNKARQQVLVNNRNLLEYGVIKQVEARANMIAQEKATDGEAPDAAAINAAMEEALAELTPEERAAYDEQASAMGAFAKTFAIEIAKAGAMYVGTEIVRDLLADSETIDAAKALGGLQALQAARQLKKAMGMVEAAAELDGLIKYIENGLRLDEATTNN